MSAVIALSISAAPLAAQTGFPVRDATGRPPPVTAPAPPAQPPRPPAWHPQPQPGHPPYWRPPVTVIYGPAPEQFIPWPFQYNLPNPPYGMVWMRSNNDAVLFDRINRTIVQVRSRWFG